MLTVKTQKDSHFYAVLRMSYITQLGALQQSECNIF